MRIIAGKHRGTKLIPPPREAGQDIRPTSDRAREAIFNVLAHGYEISLEDATVVDLFAGTGAMGFEALSRGAAKAIFVDNNALAISLIKENAKKLRREHDVTTYSIDASRLPRYPGADAGAVAAFIDAPYKMGLETAALESLRDQAWLQKGAAVVVEASAKEDLVLPDGYTPYDVRKYGAAKVHFLTFSG